MLLEMHAHSAEYSACSSVSAKDLIRQVCAKGLDGIVLTDHHHLWSPEALRHLRRATKVPEHFLILSRQEVSMDFGDMLVYGADRSFGRNTPVTGAISEPVL
jgi:predicted metal-dependent phosphoesterase TrpH